MFVKEYRDKIFDFPFYGKKAFGVRILATESEIISRFNKEGAVVPSAVLHIIRFHYEDLLNSKLAQKKDALEKLLKTVNLRRQGDVITLELAEDEDTIYSGAIEFFQLRDQKGYQLFLSAQQNDPKLLSALVAACLDLLNEYPFAEGAACIIFSANRLLLKGFQELLSGKKEELILCDAMCFKDRLEEVPDAADADADAEGLAGIVLEEDPGQRGFLPAYLMTRLYNGEELTEADHEMLADLAVTVDHLASEAEKDSLLFSLMDKALESGKPEDVLAPSDAGREYGLHLADIRRDSDTWEAFSSLFPDEVNYREYPGQLLGAVDRDDMAVGALAVTEDELCMNVDYLFVPKDCRRKGIGSFLMRALVSFSEDLSHPKEIRAQFSTDNWDLMYFFSHLRSFSFADSDAEYYIPDEEINENKWIRRLAGMPADVQHYEELPSQLKEKLLLTLKENNLIHMIDRQSFDENLLDDLSFVKINDGRIEGVILTKPADAKERTVELFVIYSSDQKTTVELLSAVSAAMLQEYPDYGFITTPINDQSRDLLFKLFEHPEVRQYKTAAVSNEVPF